MANEPVYFGLGIEITISRKCRPYSFHPPLFFFRLLFTFISRSSITEFLPPPFVHRSPFLLLLLPPRRMAACQRNAIWQRSRANLCEPAFPSSAPLVGSSFTAVMYPPPILRTYTQRKKEEGGGGEDQCQEPCMEKREKGGGTLPPLAPCPWLAFLALDPLLRSLRRRSPPSMSAPSPTKMNWKAVPAPARTTTTTTGMEIPTFYVFPSVSFSITLPP